MAWIKAKWKKLFLHGGKTWWEAEAWFVEQLRTIILENNITHIIAVVYPWKTEKKTLLMKNHFPDLDIRSDHEVSEWFHDEYRNSTLLYLPWWGSNLELYHKVILNPILWKALNRSHYLFWSSAGMMILWAWFRSWDIKATRHPWFNICSYRAEPHLHERDRVEDIKIYQKTYPSHTIIWVDEETIVEIDRSWEMKTYGKWTSIIYEASEEETPHRYIYILRCADNSLYTWITTDLPRRLIEHNSSPLGASYTKNKRPVTCIWSQSASNRYEASKCESRIKKLTKQMKEALVLSQHPFTLEDPSP